MTRTTTGWRRTTLGVSMALAIAAGAITTGAGRVHASGPTVQLNRNLLHTISKLTPSGATAPSQVLHLGFGLARPNPSGEAAYLRAVYTRGNPLYHQFLTPASFEQRFGVPQARYDQLTEWLRGGGLSVTGIAGSHDYVLASGTAAQVSNLLSISFKNYSSGGQAFYANTSAPTVPASLDLDAIAGLNSLEGPRLNANHYAPRTPVAAGPRAAAPALGAPSTGLTTPMDLWDVYQQPDSNKGNGQSMAIFGWGTTNQTQPDLTQFEQEYKLPAIQLDIRYYGTETTITDSIGETEWNLDTQASTGMAPNVVGEKLYFGKAGSDADLIAAYTAWAGDSAGPLQGSSSFSGCEEDPVGDQFAGGPGTPSGLIILGNPNQSLYEKQLSKAVSMGRTMFASSGDTGNSCPFSSLVLNGVTLGTTPEQGYPAISPYAVGVDGTVLYTNGAHTATTPATRFSEISWTHTGGGTSAFIAAPPYQSEAFPPLIGRCLTDPTGNPYSPPLPLCRGSGDVAAQSGDVATNGYTITVKGANDQAGGGTSLSSPLWLGMWTRIQAASHATGGVGFANPAIYDLVGVPAGGIGPNPKYAADFFDVGDPATGASIVTCNSAPGPFTCSHVGWDYISGWGTPKVKQLMLDLTGHDTPANPTVPNPPPTAEVTGPIFNACGPLFTDPAGDDSFQFATPPGTHYPQLDILQGDMSLSPDGQFLVTKLTLNSLSKTVPNGGGTNQYYMVWQYTDAKNVGHQYFSNVQVDQVGTVTYSDGEVILTGTTRRYTKRSATTPDTGSFVEGANGYVTVNVPLSAVGSVKVNDILHKPDGETYVTVGSPTGSPASLQPVDSASPKFDYLAGQVCAGAVVPEAPAAGVLLLLGGSTAGMVALARRRRRGRRIAV